MFTLTYIRLHKHVYVYTSIYTFTLEYSVLRLHFEGAEGPSGLSGICTFTFPRVLGEHSRALAEYHSGCSPSTRILSTRIFPVSRPIPSQRLKLRQVIMAEALSCACVGRGARASHVHRSRVCAHVALMKGTRAPLKGMVHVRLAPVQHVHTQ